MTDTPTQPTGTAAKVLDELHLRGCRELPDDNFEQCKAAKTEAAHQLYLAELERIGDDVKPLSPVLVKTLGTKINGPVYEQIAVIQNMLRAELREKARLFYGQDKEKV